MVLIGELALWVALLMAGWAAGLSFAGSKMGRADLSASGRRALHVTAAALLVATAGVVAALLTRDFSIAYVTRHSSAELRRAYTVTALWSGSAGALLVTALLLALLAAPAVASAARRDRTEAAWTAGTAGTLLAACLLVVGVVHNPYARLGWLPADGSGLDPALRHALAVPARPLVLLGYAVAGVAVAVAAGVAAADTARVRWRAVRPWALGAWVPLTAGIALQMRGAYLYGAAPGLWRWAPGTVLSAATWIAAGVALHLLGRSEHGSVWRLAERLAYAGAVLAGVALAAGLLATSRTAQLRTGQAVQLHDPLHREWRFVSQGVSQYGAEDHNVIALTLEGGRAGGTDGLVVARQLRYGDAQSDTVVAIGAQPAVRPSLLFDTRVVLDSAAIDAAQFRISFVPLASLFWLGAAVLVLAGVVAAGGLVFETEEEPGS